MVQDKVEVFLGASAATDVPATRVDSHAAMVLPSGDRALKIRRAVKLPFLNFPTLDRRKDQRHRLRMRAKRFRYALDWSRPVLAKHCRIVRKQIQQARAIQNALGKLNDAATHRTQAESLGIAPLLTMAHISRRKSRHGLLKTATHALETLEHLKLGI